MLSTTEGGGVERLPLCLRGLLSLVSFQQLNCFGLHQSKFDLAILNFFLQHSGLARLRGHLRCRSIGDSSSRRGRCCSNGCWGGGGRWRRRRSSGSGSGRRSSRCGSGNRRCGGGNCCSLCFVEQLSQASWLCLFAISSSFRLAMSLRSGRLSRRGGRCLGRRRLGRRRWNWLRKDVLEAFTIKNFWGRPLAVQIMNGTTDLVFDLINGLLLLSSVHVFVFDNLISETFCLSLDLLLSFALRVRLLRLLRNNLVDFSQSKLFLLLLCLLLNVLGLFGESDDVFVGGFGPLLHVDFAAEIKVTLNATKNLLEHCVAKVSLKQFFNLPSSDLALAEGHGSIRNYATHLLRQLCAHSVIDLEVGLPLSDLVLCDSLLLIELRLVLHAVLHLLHLEFKRVDNLLQLELRLLDSVLRASFKLGLNL